MSRETSIGALLHALEHKIDDANAIAENLHEAFSALNITASIPKQIRSAREENERNALYEKGGELLLRRLQERSEREKSVRSFAEALRIIAWITKKLPSGFQEELKPKEHRVKGLSAEAQAAIFTEPNKQLFTGTIELKNTTLEAGYVNEHGISDLLDHLDQEPVWVPPAKKPKTVLTTTFIWPSNDNYSNYKAIVTVKIDALWKKSLVVRKKKAVMEFVVTWRFHFGIPRIKELREIVKLRKEIM